MTTWRKPFYPDVCPYCGSTSSTAPAKPSRENGLPAFPASPTAQEPQAQVKSLSLVVAGSGRQIYLPAISIVYLGRHDERQNIYPHIDFTQDNGVICGVSRRHARIHQSDGGAYIEDIGSSNGTFVNGQRLHPFEIHPLYHGDALQLGQLKLEVVFLYEKAATWHPITTKPPAQAPPACESCP